MNGTLLGLAIAMIVALVAALAAPLFVDWTQHRGWFEAQLTQLAGAPARIDGPIDAALLPTPRFSVQRVTIGTPGKGVTIDQAQGVLALGPLLRGEVRAEELVLVRPTALLALDADGGLAAARGFQIADTAIERLVIREGRLAVTDARAGRTVSADAIDLAGEVRATGSARLEGRASVDGTATGVRLAIAPTAGEGTRLRLSFDPAKGAVIDLDGLLTFDRTVPRFAGQMTATRTLAAPLGRSRTVATIDATPQGARIDTLAVRLGPEERALALDGSASLRFGREPRLDVVLNGKQIDLDRLAGAEPGSAAGPPLTVLMTLATALELGAPWPGMATRVGFAADGILLGGDALRDLRLDLSGRDAAWSVDLMEVRLPGRSLVRASGEAGAAGSFRGPALLDIAEPQVLLRWLDGTGAVPRAARGEPLKIEARLDVRPGAVVLDALKGEGGGARLGGRIGWMRAANGRSRLDVALSGTDFDLDGLLAIARTAGVSPLIARPSEAQIDLALGGVRFAGLAARRLDLKAGYDAGALDIARLAISGYGGLSLEGRGRLTGLAPGATPGGRLDFDLTSEAADGLAALFSAVVPVLGADGAARIARVIAPSKLAIGVTGDGGPAVTVTARGPLSGGRLDLRADVPVAAPEATSLSVQLDAAEGARLAALAGLTTSAPGPGKAQLDWSGLREGKTGMAVVQVAVPGFEGEAKGSVAVGETADGLEVFPDFALRIARADLLALGLSPTRAPASGYGTAHLRRAGAALSLEHIDARLAGQRVTGALRVAGRAVSGALDAERIDAETLVKLFAGASGSASGWSGEAFGPPAIATEVALDVALTTPQLVLGGGLAASAGKIALKHAGARSEMLLADGRLGGGVLSGRLVTVRADSGVAVEARGRLAEADLAALLPRAGPPGAPRPSGRIALELETSGTGRSPAAIIAALAGQGTARIEALSWPALSPGVFAALAPLGREATAPDERKVQAAAIAGLARGPATLARLDLPLAIASGQLRTGTVTADLGEVRATGSLAVDLTRLMLKGALDLAAKAPVLPGAPDLGVRWEGLIGAADRKLDVTALVTALSLAAVERETKLLEEREARRLQSAMPPPPEPAPVVLTPAPAASTPTASVPPAAAPPLVPVQPRPPASVRPPQSPTVSRDAAPALPPPVIIAPPWGQPTRRPSSP